MQLTEKKSLFFSIELEEREEEVRNFNIRSEEEREIHRYFFFFGKTTRLRFKDLFTRLAAGECRTLFKGCLTERRFEEERDAPVNLHFCEARDSPPLKPFDFPLFHSRRLRGRMEKRVFNKRVIPTF